MSEELRRGGKHMIDHVGIEPNPAYEVSTRWYRPLTLNQSVYMMNHIIGKRSLANLPSLDGNITSQEEFIQMLIADQLAVRKKYGIPSGDFKSLELTRALFGFADDQGILIIPFEEDEGKKSPLATAAAEIDEKTGDKLLSIRSTRDTFLNVTDPDEISNNNEILAHEITHLLQPGEDIEDFDILLREYEAYLAGGVIGDIEWFSNRLFASTSRDELQSIGVDLDSPDIASPTEILDDIANG